MLRRSVCHSCQGGGIGRCSLELGHLLDSVELVVPVVHFESFAGESVRLHALVVPGAEGVQIVSLLKLLELLGSLVHIEDLLDAVEVLADVLLVQTHADSTFDLVLKTVIHFLFFINYITNSIEIII